MRFEIIESWEIIKDTHNMYVVSDRGRIGKIVNGDEVEIIIDVDDEGRANKKYKTVWLFGQKYYIHVLVAQYFLPTHTNPECTQVHHCDHDNRFNCVTNLQWTTVRYNNQLRTWDKQYKFDWEELRWI